MKVMKIFALGIMLPAFAMEPGPDAFTREFGILHSCDPNLKCKLLEYFFASARPEQIKAVLRGWPCLTPQFRPEAAFIMSCINPHLTDLQIYRYCHLMHRELKKINKELRPKENDPIWDILSCFVVGFKFAKEKRTRDKKGFFRPSVEEFHLAFQNRAAYLLAAERELISFGPVPAKRPAVIEFLKGHGAEKNVTLFGAQQKERRMTDLYCL